MTLYSLCVYVYEQSDFGHVLPLHQDNLRLIFEECFCFSFSFSTVQNFSFMYVY